MAVEASLANALNMLRTGQPADALAGLRVGQSVDATVLAKLDTGEIRLALLGTLLDIVSPSALEVGEPLRLTVVDRSGQLSVALERLDPRPAPAPLPEAQPAPVRAPGPAATIRPESAGPALAPSPVTVSTAGSNTSTQRSRWSSQFGQSSRRHPPPRCERRRGRDRMRSARSSPITASPI